MDIFLHNYNTKVQNFLIADWYDTIINNWSKPLKKYVPITYKLYININLYSPAEYGKKRESPFQYNYTVLRPGFPVTAACKKVD